MKRARTAALSGLLLVGAALAPGRSRAQDSAPDVAPLFQRGRIELLAGGGYGLDNDRSYLILALGGGYYVRDGLSLGVVGESWLGSRPQIYNLSPYARFVFLDSTWRYKPYAGVFYRRTSYASLSGPIDSAGLRGGLVFPLSGRAYLTGGLAFEHRFQDATNVTLDRDLLYPELGLQFTF